MQNWICIFFLPESMDEHWLDLSQWIWNGNKHFVREWVDYHINQGVEWFVFFWCVKSRQLEFLISHKTNMNHYLNCELKKNIIQNTNFSGALFFRVVMSPQKHVRPLLSFGPLSVSVRMDVAVCCHGNPSGGHIGLMATLPGRDAFIRHCGRTLRDGSGGGKGNCR